MRLLIVEHDKALAEGLKSLLNQQGYAADTVYDGDCGLDYGLSELYDLILLDTCLPKRDGLSLLRTLREERIEAPVLLLSGENRPGSCAAGLDCGADDYLCKPFDPQELLARVRALTRRSRALPPTEELAFGDLRLDRRGMVLCCGENRVRLKAKEFQLLEYLIAAKQWAVPRQFLCEKVWGLLSEAEYNNVEVYMTFLRRRLREVGSRVKIRFLRGGGYYLEMPK